MLGFFALNNPLSARLGYDYQIATITLRYNFIIAIIIFNYFIIISKRIDLKVDAYKHDYQVFEFIDINRFAIKLVKEFEDIRNEISAKYKMIMIDEYQDTSLIQECFIEQISNNNVYMVGDIKQSIYRFRNAVCDIFKDKYTNYSNNNGGVSIDLNKNFRSRKEVLDDINFMFKQIMSLDMGGADYRASHIIEYGNKKYIKKGSSDQNNNSEFILYSNDSITLTKSQCS